jgi:Protein of unknown function (DUF1573)
VSWFSVAGDSQIGAAMNSHEKSGHEGACEVMDSACSRRSAFEPPCSASVALFIVSLIFLGVGAISVFYVTTRDRTGELLRFDERVKSFGHARSGQKAAAIFALTNESGQPIRILGADRFCATHGCLDVSNLPLDIPPNSTRDLVLVVDARRPGEFHGYLTLFSNCPGQPKTALTVTGTVIEKARDNSLDGGEAVERGNGRRPTTLIDDRVWPARAASLFLARVAGRCFRRLVRANVFPF